MESPQPGFRDLNIGPDFLPRLGSAAVLAPIVIGIVAWGGWPFVLLAFIAAVLILWEWAGIVHLIPRSAYVLIGGSGVAVVLFGQLLGEWLGLLALPATALMAALATAGNPPARNWAAAGVLYAAALALPVVVLRLDPLFGLLAIIWLLAVVWTSDIAAYFCGRLIGGPKLWPRVSPNKTWSGALGGAFFAVGAGMLTLWLAGVTSALLAAPAAFLVSVVSQAGDLFESAMKRHFGVKDSSQLIPGHGGLMDRVDALITAAAVACLIGLIRNSSAPATGLLVW